MRRLAFVPLLALVAACPGDKKPSSAARADSFVLDSSALDTTRAVDLGQVKTSLPPAMPDTFTVHRVPPARAGATRSEGGDVAAASRTASFPAAPEPLLTAVEREQSFTRFCYQEFGQKADPSLVGNVAMVITVGKNGIEGARVGDSNWSSRAAGNAVNQCLNDKAPQAWRLAPGAVTPGRYVVQLSFRGS